MADEKDKEKNQNANRSPVPTKKSVREVVVRHLDAPPPSGKQQIHPRRPAPIVPTRKERTEKQDENTSTDKPPSE